MEQAEVAEVPERSLWRRIAEYPLVAMLIAIALVILGIVISGFIAALLQKLVLPPSYGLKLETLV